MTASISTSTDHAQRLRYRVQTMNDGRNAYLLAVNSACGSTIDFAQLVKLYGTDPEPERRYLPAVCIGATATVVSGDPDPECISTTYVERQSLTMCMSMCRFTRLTNAFSKKVENLTAALSLHFMYHNSSRVHKTLGTTPAVAAGVADHVWLLDELVATLEEAESTLTRRGRYAKRRGEDSN